MRSRPLRAGRWGEITAREQMSVYHLNVSDIQRSDGRSVIAAAAYRSGTRLRDPLTGRWHNYTGRKRRGDILAGAVVGWQGSRQELWAAVEQDAKRHDAILATEWLVALACELTLNEQVRCVEMFALELAALGCAVDWNVHRASNSGDARNTHAHILVTRKVALANGLLGTRVREFERGGRAAKTLRHFRARWARITNDALADAGWRTGISEKSLRSLGRQEEPQIHLGAAAAMERRGIRTDRGDRWRAIAHGNADACIPKSGAHHKSPRATQTHTGNPAPFYTQPSDAPALTRHNR